MSERYEQISDFLKSVIAKEVPLSGSVMAEANMLRLIEMTRDDDRTNRDWATMLLSQEEIDTLEVHSALLVAADDDDDVVRAEALLGLARRDRKLTLPFALRALAADRARMAVFEAAAIISDPVLVESLAPWTEASDDGWLDRLARDALAACEAGSPINSQSGHNNTPRPKA